MFDYTESSHSVLYVQYKYQQLQSAQSGADANTHNQHGGLLSILLIVGVQGDLLGGHWQVSVRHEVSKESPDYKFLVSSKRV